MTGKVNPGKTMFLFTGNEKAEIPFSVLADIFMTLILLSAALQTNRLIHQTLFCQHRTPHFLRQFGCGQTAVPK